MTSAMIPKTEAIWQAFHQRLAVWLAQRVRASADVDDLLQEIFIRVHQNLGQLRQADRLSAWLFQITRNALTDYYRSHSRRLEVYTGAVVDPELNRLNPAQETETLALAAQQTLADCLKPLLKLLPEKYQTAIELCDFQGITQADAATQLGISVSATKSRVQRGRKELRKLLEACCTIEQDRQGRISEYNARRQPDSDHNGQSPCKC